MAHIFTWAMRRLAHVSARAAEGRRRRRRPPHSGTGVERRRTAPEILAR